MTLRSSMREMMRISREHFGHMSGSASQTFLISSRHLADGMRRGLCSETSITSMVLVTTGGVDLHLFTISGTRIAESMEVSPGVCILMGYITGVAGGVFRDVLSGEVSLLWRDRELYATAAIGGSIVYLALVRWLDVPVTTAALCGMVAVAALRFFSCSGNGACRCFS